MLFKPTGGRTFWAAILFVLGLAASPPALAGAEGQPGRFSLAVPEPGVDEVGDIAALPLLRFNSLTRQVSSHDKTGGNSDGLAGQTQLYIDDKGEYVVFDDYGPGCIYRMWFTGLSFWDATARIFVDDMQNPVVECSFAALFSGSVPPFAPPLVYDIYTSSGGFVSYVPICYQSRAKITLSSSPEYYNITYRRYDADRVLSSFSGDEDYSRLMEQWSHLGQDPKPPETVRIKKKTVYVPPGQSRTILSETGAGAIWNVLLDGAPSQQSMVPHVWLRARWDNHQEHDVAAPLNEFFGSYYLAATPQSLLIGSSGGRYCCRLPMPYWSSAEISIENRSTGWILINSEIEILDAVYPPDSGYFTAVYRQEAPTTYGRDYRFADLEGSGHFVGVTYTMTGPADGSYLEGDERFHVDGSRSPALYGTGTEDYFNGGAYFYFGPFTLPVHGCPYKFYKVGGRRRTGCYRLHLGDMVPFFDRLCLGIEHDGGNWNTNDTHSSVAYLYRRDCAALVPADTLDLDDPDSRLVHAYSAVGAAETGVIQSYFEGDDDTLLVADNGYEVGTSCQFVMQIDPHNQGVLLRRQLDQSRGRQTGQVFVDGAPAGTWYDPAENQALRWAESDFLLPASLTAGKSAIQIAVVNQGEGPWTEFRYKTFCTIWP